MNDNNNLLKCSVLIVDDDESNLQLAAKIINNAGYDVLIAEDGRSALEILETTIPDAILLDIIMPGINGLEVCKEIRSKPEFSSVPILFLSGSNKESSVEKGLEIGGSDYIVKPFNERVLLARLKHHIKSGQYEKKISENNRVLTEQNFLLTEMKEKLVDMNNALEIQIEKNLMIFASLNDIIRNPLTVAMSLIEMNEDESSSRIIEQLKKIDSAIDNLDRGFIESDKVRAYLVKHYNFNLEK